MQQLAGKVAVVTGAGSGIGRALAERFAKAGMKLAIVDIEQEPLDLAANELRDEGAEVFAARVDVGDAEQMDAFAEQVLDELGGVHVVCNNAGVGAGGPMWELEPKDWAFCFGPNLWGVIHGIRVFTKHLLAQNEGHIVNTASMAGLVSVPGLGPYNATKHAVVTMSETLFGELEAEGSEVGVSVLCPGFVSTRIWDASRHMEEGDQPPPEDRAELERTMKAFMEQQMPPSEVAELVHDAILSKRFYVFTHDRTPDEVDKRAEGMRRRDRPFVPPQDVFA